MVSTSEKTWLHFVGHDMKRANFSGDIRYSDSGEFYQRSSAGNKGSTEFLENGRTIIRGLSKPDVSTAVHELAHVFRRELGQTDPDALREVESEFGVRGGKWTRAAEDNFADQFVFYHRAGEAPSQKLKTIFKRFKGWLTKIYRKIIDMAAEKKISPWVKAFFDEMLGGSEKSPRETAQDEILEGGRGVFHTRGNEPYFSPNYS